MRGAARQRGASAVFVAISMVASIAALGMSLDLGRLYFMHRDLQLVADMAALDAARAAGGCLGQTEDPQGSAAGEAASSLQRNGASLAFLTAGNVEIGRQVSRGGVRSFVADDSTRADSVKVTLRRPLPARLVPVFSSGSSGVMAVSAAASLRPIVSIDVGSSLADVSPPIANRLFENLLGLENLDLDLASYRGLFAANVSLGDLALAANAGSVETFLDTDTTAPGLLDALANALDSSSDIAARTALRALSTGAGASGRVVPRNVLGVPAGSTAEDALVNVGALVTALSQSADGDNLLNITVPINLPLLAEGSVTVQLIELAKPAVGPALTDASGNPQTFANTAQGVIHFRGGLRPTLGNDVQMTVFVRAADASASVADLSCAKRGQPHAVVTVDARASAGRFGIGEMLDLRSPQPEFVTVATLQLPALPPLEIQARAAFEIGSEGEEPLVFEGPFPAAPQFVSTDPAEALPDAIDESRIQLQLRAPNVALSADANRAVSDLIAALRPELARALGEIYRDVVQPTLPVLGAQVGSARVAVRSVVAQQPEIYAR